MTDSASIFLSGALTIGTELRAAQEELAEHKAGFYVWCKERFDWSKSQVHRMMDAAEVMRITSPIGDVAPANEAQCRELAKVPKEQQAEVWRQIVMASEETETPITAARIKKHIKKQPVEGGGGGGDEEKPKKTAKTVKPDKPADDEEEDDEDDEWPVPTGPAGSTASIVLDALEQPIPLEYRSLPRFMVIGRLRSAVSV